MSLTSLHFVYFLLAVLLVYYLLPRRGQNYWLLAASYIFYVSWAWQFALLLLLSTAANFTLARRLRRNGQNRRWLLWAGVLLNVTLLLIFRLAHFYLPELLTLMARGGIELRAGGLQILLPVGLAYYTLQNISYLVDVYRGQLQAATDPVDFALYLAYFPKLLSGPIERARSFLPRLAQPRLVDNGVLAKGLTLIVIGLARKLLVADTLASIIFWNAFETPAFYTGPELIGWLLLYGFYLYNDFAGYTSMARGVSQLFGIELAANFKQPYFARTFAEFWNSWHITLSHWLRDYIFFPASRALLRRNPSRRNLANLLLPPLVTMLVSGLWHGLGWGLLVWGGLHGLYQVAERLPSLWRPVVPAQQQPRWRQGLSILIVQLLVTAAWVPFVMELPTALAYWQGMLDWTYPIIRFRRIFFLVPFFAAIMLLDWFQYRADDEAIFLRWPRPVQASLLAACLFLLMIIGQVDYEEPFVYLGF
jgi:alginate O-acetyltransferase complex protein AlgI